MRKHFFGLAIFISIVTAAVFVYAYFNTPPIPVIPAVEYAGDFIPPEIPSLDCERLEIDYKVSAAEFVESSGEFRARINLKWLGRNRPPTKLYLNLFLRDAGGDGQMWAMKGDVFERPFSNGNKTEIVVSFDKFATKRFSGWDNIYAFVDFADDGNFPASNEERFALAEPIPVLKIHDRN